MNKNKRKFPAKTVLVVSLLLIAIAGGFFFITSSVNDTINNLYMSNLEEMAEHDKNTIGLRLDAYWTNIDNVIDDVRTWHAYDNSDLLKLLNSDSYFIPNIHRLALLAEDGTFYKSSGSIEYRPELLGYCKKNPERHVTRASNFDIFNFQEEVKELLMFICPVTPFEADGHLFKYVFCSVMVSGLEKEFMIPAFQGEGWSCIVDGEGNFLVHIHKSQHFLEDINIFDLIDADSIGDFTTITDLKNYIKRNSKPLSIKSELDFLNGTVEEAYILFSPIPHSDWVIVSVTPTTVFRKHTIRIMAIVFILLALIIVTCLIIVIIVLRQRQKQQNLSSQMFDRFSQEFTSVYLVNAKDNTYRVLKRTEYLNRTYPQEMNFTASIDAYIAKDVHPSDRDIVRQATRHDFILKKLREEDKFTIRFRDISGKADSPRWFEMTAARVDVGDTFSYLLGFADNHEQVMADFIREKMYDSYVSVYYINLLNDSYKTLKYPSTTDIMYAMTGEKWSAASTAFFNACCDEETRATVAKIISDVNKLQEEVSKESLREYTYRWNYGEKLWRRLVVYAFERDHDKVSSVILAISTLDDLTAENQELARQLQSALDKAEAANTAKTLFLNSMSHDIRTPMNAILGFTDIAKKHIDDKQKVIESIDKVQNASAHLLSLINDVLDMSRIESGTVEITPVESDFRKLKDRIAPMFDSLAQDKNITFTIDTSAIKNPIVKLDRLRMNQVIINIVSNAIKYTNNGGTVTLSINQAQIDRYGFAKYIISVADNGIGMSAEFQKHMFDTFSREEKAAVEKREGTGLGLAITKRLVDLMGGSILVQSEPGIGTTFTIMFDLEIVEQSMHNEIEEETIRTIENLKGKRILLVDDNDFNREIVVENLTDEGVLVEEATNGAEAVEKVHLAGASYFDCVLMDIRMPVMNGYEAIKAIRQLGEDYCSLPIIALSANAFEEDVEKSKEYGMCAHLSKPVRVNELLDTLNRFAK